jgi:beta-glucanase (GH16 family)
MLGRKEVRAKVDPGQGTAGAGLLWPSDNGFPPEVDLLETPEGDRSKAHFTYHWDAGYDAYESHGFPLDTSEWHTYAVDWTADRLTYYIDGREMFSTTSNVPQESMALGFMGWVARDDQNWHNSGPDESTPDQVSLHVDWARISVADGDSQGGGGSDPEHSSAAEPEAVDWDALAARAQANFETTGQWFI